MFKKGLSILALMVILPVFAVSFDYSIANSQKVFLYLYTSNCGYCTKFNPIFAKLSLKYENKCKFLKVNLDTEQGSKLIQQYNVSYVPYVLLIDNSKHSINRITPKCLLNYACINDALDKFTN